MLIRTLSLHPIGGASPWGFFVQVVLPGLHARRTYLHDDDLATKISTPDGSWALVAHTPHNGGYRTIQGGPRRLWNLLETARQQWSELGEPGWQRFGLTVTPDRQWVWLDAPDSAHRWPMASLCQHGVAAGGSQAPVAKSRSRAP